MEVKKVERFGPLPIDAVLPNAQFDANAPLSENVCSEKVPEGETDWYPPVMIGANAVGTEIARNCKKYLEDAIKLIERLEPDGYIQFLQKYYSDGLERFGVSWGYLDIVTAILGISEILKPNSYLEIGVRRGRSVCALASKRPAAKIAMFDMWVENYAGMDNPGPDHVNKELDKIGHTGERLFVNGDSHRTLKAHFAEHPDDYYDLITVDGDHSNMGAAEDIADVLPRLRVGGVILFDDTCNPNVSGLGDVWKRMVVQDPRFSSYTYSDVGYGVGFAIRKY